jgi:hypothetical protein
MNLSPYQTDRTQVEHEARAKIFWGDPPEGVFTYLLGQGVSVEEAQDLVDSMLAERVRALRGIGIGKIFLGGAMMLVPVVTLGFFARLPIFPIKLFGIAVAVGLWGAWRVMKGCFLFFAPKSEAGDVADL